MTFEIKPAAEVPDDRVRYPFPEMKVGEAFICPSDHPGAERIGRNTKVAVAAYTYGRVHGMKFTTSRQRDGSVRIERTA